MHKNKRFEFKPTKIRWDSYGTKEEWQSTRNRILQRDNYTCVRCGASLRNTNQRAVHHEKHLSAGGLTIDRNLKSLCATCHAAEHGHLRATTTKSIFKPSKKQIAAYHARKRTA